MQVQLRLAVNAITIVFTENAQTVMLDVDECVISNGGCDTKRTCTNTAGSRICGNCPSGYVNDGDTDCEG